MSSFQPPDVLVLGGGGVLGEAWMSAVLAGIEEASGFDARDCSGFVGTSAGSIVASALAAGLAAGERLGALPSQPADPEPAGVGGGSGSSAGAGVAARAVRSGFATAAAPVAALALPTIAPGGAFVRRFALARAPRGTRSLGGMARRIDSLGARFDGRLMVSAVDIESGRRVMFGRAGAPEASVGEAVEASCAIPGYFRPVSIGGREYVDGGAWSPTNLDTVRASRGTQVLCLNPTGSIPALGVASNAMARVEALVVERRGARVDLVAPDEGARAAIGRNLMDPRPRRAVIAAGFEQGRRLGAAA